MDKYALLNITQNLLLEATLFCRKIPQMRAESRVFFTSTPAQL